ncbi:MAG: RNA polymerase recycling motor HelD [Solirubrobacterales bacterium]
MSINHFEWEQEIEWLELVLKETQKQLQEELDYKNRFRRDAIETQKEMWEELGSVSVTNGLEQIVSFMGFIDIMKYQKRNHEITQRLQDKYEKMLQSPYFARIDFLENGDKNPGKYYIGMSTLMDDNYDFLVYDWRAPASSMFYDYELGKAGYKCDEGTIEGELTLKRQYKISNGKMDYMFDSSVNIEDETLQEILGKSSDSKMKTIVTTIQREQNRVIRNEEYKNLIVQGPAGSGKTSIALHRIAYLLYKHRDKIRPENIVIFSPNQIFNDYISNVLPSLGEDNMLQTTFTEYMHKALGDGFIKESYSDMMEFILGSKKLSDYEIRIKSIKYKSSLEFADLLKSHVKDIEKTVKTFKDIVFRDKVVISSKDLLELYYKDYRSLPLIRRLKKIGERILFLLKPYEEERMNEIYHELWDSGSFSDIKEAKEKAKALVQEETKNIYVEINKIAKFDLLDIYKKLFENLDPEIKKYTLKNIQTNFLNYEDQVPLLYLKGMFGDLPKTSDIKYVIIDEAQDYTPLQYEILYQLFNHAGITMLGDLNQSINPFMNIGDYSNIAHIFPKENTCIINLTKSYRSTMEIAKFTRKILNNQVDAEYIERSGDEPKVSGFSDQNHLNEQVLKDIELCRSRGYKSIGIITRTKKEAKMVYSFLQDKTEVKVLTKDGDDYINGTLVIPVHLAKGLEFDAVLIYNAGNENYNSEDERLLLYTACTRALHKLNVYYEGKLTPLIN